MPPPLNPAILVAYATSTGTTREIAERIATTLEKTTSWHVDCKSVAELPSLHKQLHQKRAPPAPAQPSPSQAEELGQEPGDHAIHPNPLSALIPHPPSPRSGTPPPAPAETEPPKTAAAEDHTIHANPLSALIPPAEEPPVEYKAIVIGSSIHVGQWIGSGRGFITRNKDFFNGTCCDTKPCKCQCKGVLGALSFWGSQQNQEPEVRREEERRVPPKVYAFSVGMPGNDETFKWEQDKVEAALRKALGKRWLNEKKEEEEEVLQQHVLFRGMWSPRQLEILAPRFVNRLVRWCVPKESKFLEEDDERDWEGIEKWARKVGKEIVGGGAVEEA